VSVSLHEGVVQLWICSMSGLVFARSDLARMLSDDERRRAAAIGSREVRGRFVHARAVLRCVLGGALGIPPDRVRFQYGDRGKPSLHGHGARSIRFNSSHSDELVLIALSRERAVGVDVERVRPIDMAPALAGRFLPSSSRTHLSSLHDRGRDEAFLRLWTVREALAKASGRGLGASRGLLDISPTGGDLSSVDVGGRQTGRWFARGMNPADGYVATLVAEGRDWNVSVNTIGVSPLRRDTMSALVSGTPTILAEGGSSR
jgi:4'-phosphopantetheinyl transferase